MTAAELIFQIKALGADELQKVALATQSIGEGTRLAGANLKTFDATLNSLVASGKTFKQSLEEMARSQGVLSSAVRSTASSLLDQIKAAEGDSVAIKRLSLDHQQLTGNTLQARAAVQALNGSLSTMAAGRWLAQLQGLGPLLANLFPIVGAAAFGEVLFRLVERFDPLKKATQDLSEVTKQLDSDYAALGRRLDTLTVEDITAKFGKARGAMAAAQISEQHNKASQEAIDDMSFAIKRAQQLAARAAIENTLAQKFLPKGTGIGLFAEHNQAAADKNLESLLLQKQYLTAALQGDQQQTQTDKDKAAKDKKTEDAEASRKAAAEAKRLAEEAKRGMEVTAALQKELTELSVKELTVLDKINAKHTETIQKLAEQRQLTAENLDLANKIAVAQKSNAWQDTLRHAQSLAVGREGTDYRATEKDPGIGASQKYTLSAFVTALRELIRNEEHAITASDRINNASDAADIEGINRGTQVSVHRNATKVASGRMGAGSAANADLQTRVSAAQSIFDLATRGMDIHRLDAAMTDVTAGKDVALSEQEWKDAEKLAEARKRYADEIYQAEAQNEEALDALRAKDLEKYRSEAGKIYDAITNRQRGAGYSLTHMLREEAVGQGRQIFSNATAPILQTVGHALGSVTGGSSFGGLLNGTIFDPKNKDGDPAKTTAKQTTRTADEVYNLRMLLTGGVNTTSGASVNPSTALGTAIPAGVSSTSTVTNAASALSKVFGGGTASAFSSDLANFGHGVSSVASGNALSILVNGTGTAANQVGAGVGLAGALGAGAYGIASGVSQGGAQGALKAAGSAAGLAGLAVSSVAKLVGAASPLLSAIPVVGAIAAAALPLIGSLFGSGVTQRTNQLNSELAMNQYQAPTALNVTQSTNGTYESFDSRGLLRTSTLSAVPTVAEPFVWAQTHGTFGPPATYYDVPGGVKSPYSGTPTGTGQAPVSNAGMTVIVQGDMHAMDSESFHSFLQKPGNSQAVGDSLATHLQTSEGRASSAIRFLNG